MKKLLVIGIIILFLGVALAPSLYADTLTKDELVDVNIKFCGLGTEHTVQLTHQQIDELDELFESIRGQLDIVETKEETVQVYNKAIEKFKRYGLLGTYSIEQVQKLVTGGFQKPGINRYIDRLYNKIQVDDNSNIFCFISGMVNNSAPVSPSTFIVFNLFKLIPSKLILLPIRIILSLYLSFRLLLNFIIPLSFGSLLLMDNGTNGYLDTIGLFGVKSWSGDFYGQMVWDYPNAGRDLYGAIGFTGLAVCYLPEPEPEPDPIIKHSYIGFAPYVNIGYQPPN